MKIAWIATYVLVLLWSGIRPKNYFIWFLEVLPALIGFVIITITYRRFRFTTLVYILILIHCIILMVGGHYTCAEVPLFDWLKEILDLERNNYDKVGHFAQGFIPAIIAREILIRKSVVKAYGWLNFIAVSICLALSAFYELIEWWVAVLTEESAEAFLGTQGYVWDTQSDMSLALTGAILALVFLSKAHNYQLESMAKQNTN